MLSGSSVMALIFSIFEFSVAIASMKTSKFLLAALVSFVAQRCACQLLLGICQLTFGMFTFYFLWTWVIETIVAAVDLIWDAGGQKKKLWEQAMLLLSPALSLQFRRSSGEKTPLWRIRRIRMPSQTPIHTRKGAFGPTQKIKKGGEVLPAHSQFCLLTPLLISQTKPFGEFKTVNSLLMTKY